MERWSCWLESDTFLVMVDQGKVTLKSVSFILNDLSKFQEKTLHSKELFVIHYVVNGEC
jgi:hypothetical protein